MGSSELHTLLGLCLAAVIKFYRIEKEKGIKNSLLLLSRIADIDKLCNGVLQNSVSQQSYNVLGTQTLCQRLFLVY